MSGFFENLGRKLGRAAVPTYRKSKWVWDGLTGTEEEALAAERELGKAMAAEMRMAAELVDYPELLDWIRGICRRLQGAVDQPGFQYHCELIAAEPPSVIALPGGYLFASPSLVDFCGGKPDELAFVIAHETAHVMLRHTWDRLIQQSALKAASVVTRQAGVLGNWLGQVGLPLLRGAHSNEREFEADEAGLELARAAGYDPAGAIAFLRRIERAGPDPETLGEYLASHPAPGERIERLARIMR